MDVTSVIEQAVAALEPGGQLVGRRALTGGVSGAGLASGDVEQGLNRSVVLHGDYWPGNVLWQGGRLAAVIDWEDASLGDPLADLATARVELLCRYGDAAMERFTARYLAVHKDTSGPLHLDTLPLWELYVSASALAAMGGSGPRAARGSAAPSIDRALLRSGCPAARMSPSARSVGQLIPAASLARKRTGSRSKVSRVAMRWWCMPPPTTWLVTLSQPP